MDFRNGKHILWLLKFPNRQLYCVRVERELHRTPNVVVEVPLQENRENPIKLYSKNWQKLRKGLSVKEKTETNHRTDKIAK